MKRSFKLSFSDSVFLLFLTVLVLTVSGTLVNTAPMCVWCPLGWLLLVHTSVVGIASVLMLFVFRKAWREQREEGVILSITTILCVMFFSQALIGARKLIQSYPTHLLLLHSLTTISVWVLLVLLLYRSRSLVADGVEPERLDTRQRIKDFLALSKPLIVGLLLITTYGGMVVGGKAWPSFSLTVWTLLGGALAAGGSSALNQYIDRHLDKYMQRTSKRPLPDGRLTGAEGLAFGLALSLASYYMLAYLVNGLAALLSLAGIVYYVVVYSLWLKKATVQNMVIGGGAGAIPPMAGYAAVTGHLDWTAWILFLIIFVWTPPHFWALSIVRVKDYERAGIPMMSVVRGELETRRQIFVYTVALVAVTLLLPIISLAGSIYLISSLILDGALIYAAWTLWRDGGNRVAWRMYKWSSVYLVLIFMAIVVDAVV